MWWVALFALATMSSHGQSSYLDELEAKVERTGSSTPTTNAIRQSTKRNTALTSQETGNSDLAIAVNNEAANSTVSSAVVNPQPAFAPTTGQITSRTHLRARGFEDQFLTYFQAH